MRIPASRKSPRVSRHAIPFRDILVLIGLLAFASLLQIGHIKSFQKLSPIDELQHLDYLLRAPSFDFPGSGDRVGLEAATVETCSRIESPFDAVVPPCIEGSNDAFDVTVLQEAGFNTSYIHPPGYYFANGAVAIIGKSIAGHNLGLLTVARLSGIIWLWAAVVFLWLAFREFGASNLISSIGITLTICAPAVLTAASTITPDGSAVALGAAALWGAGRWDRSRKGSWILPTVGAIAVLTKFTNLAGVAVATAFILAPAIRPTIRSVRSSGLKTSILSSEYRDRLGLAAVTTTVISLLFLALRFGQSMLQVIPPNELPMATPTVITTVPTVEIVSSWRIGLSPLQSPWLAPFLRVTAINALIQLVDLFVLFGALVGFNLSPLGSRSRRLASCTVGSAVLFGPVFALILYLAQGVYFPIPSRYGLSLVPALVVASIPFLKTRIGLWMGLTLALSTALATVYAVAVSLMT